MWSPPEWDWINVNFGGAARGNPGISGFGCVPRNHGGVVLARCNQGLGVSTNNESEASIALLVILLAKRVGVVNLHLEGDSKSIIQDILKGKAIYWKIDKIISEHQSQAMWILKI